MPDREKVIREFEHLLNAAKGNYQDFVDLTVDGGEEILALMKEQEAVVRCKDCNWYGDVEHCPFAELNHEDPRRDFYCADRRKRE